MITPTDDLREVLEQGVQWNPLLTSRLVTDEDLQAIQRYDTRDEDARADLMDEVREQNPIRYLIPVVPPFLAQRMVDLAAALTENLTSRPPTLLTRIAGGRRVRSRVPQRPR